MPSDPSSIASPAAPVAEKVPFVAVLAGSDANRHQGVERDIGVGVTGNNDGHTMLSMLCPSIELGRIHVAPSYFRQSKRWNPNAADLLWNIISDVDQNPDTLDIARKLVSTASRPIVNPPSLMGRTRRHTLAGLLQGLDGVIVPKVLLLRNPTLERVSKAAAEAGFRFPVSRHPAPDGQPQWRNARRVQRA